MTGHSIYIDSAKNMRNLMATYPRALTEGIDLHMGDPNQSNLPEIIRGYKGVLNGHTIMTPDLLKRSADTLCTVVFLGTGVANYVDPAVGNTLGIAVRNVAGYGDRSIAEHAFALLMAGARGLAQMDREIRGGVWRSFEGIELAGKTLGIISALGRWVQSFAASLMVLA
jgi:D-3-phosphoglycerate dehydrogenase